VVNSGRQLEDVRVHRSRSDVGHADSLFTEFLGGCATEMFDGGLGTGVCAVQSGESGQKGGDDGDDFTLGMGFNVEPGFFDEEVRRLGIDGEPVISQLAPQRANTFHRIPLR